MQDRQPLQFSHRGVLVDIPGLITRSILPKQEQWSVLQGGIRGTEYEMGMQFEQRSITSTGYFKELSGRRVFLVSSQKPLRLEHRAMCFP